MFVIFSDSWKWIGCGQNLSLRLFKKRRRLSFLPSKSVIKENRRNKRTLHIINFACVSCVTSLIHWMKLDSITKKWGLKKRLSKRCQAATPQLISLVVKLKMHWNVIFCTLNPNFESVCKWSPRLVLKI